MLASMRVVRRSLALALFVLMAANLAGCVTAGGAAFLTIKRIRAEDQRRVMALLDEGKPEDALTAANTMVSKAPEDYQGYLTRGTVQIVLKHYDMAQTDNAQALQLFETNETNLPQKEHAVELAKIHESLAWTAYLAAKQAPDDTQFQRWKQVFEEQADIVKGLDQATWMHMRDMVKSGASNTQ